MFTDGSSVPGSARPHDASTVLAGYARAFTRWSSTLQGAALLKRDSSVRAYKDVWTPLMQFVVGQNPPRRLDDLTADDLRQFLAGRANLLPASDALSDRYTWRVLRLIDRVLEVHALDNGTPPNRCAARLLASREQWQHANASQRDTLPEYLNAREAKVLVNYLSLARPRPGRASEVRSWQSVRNITAVALHLGAGLTPGEVRTLHVAHVIVDGGSNTGMPWKLVVPGDGTNPERETPLAGWAAQLLRYWIEVRQLQGLPGPYLFPSTRSGGAWSKGSHSTLINQVLDDSGIDKTLVPGGAFRLRHTFALRQLARGRSREEVARWLGTVHDQVMKRYDRVLLAPVVDVA